MIARDGFPFDMDPFAVDVGTAERLIAGRMDIADAPPEYEMVAGTLQALRDPPEPREWDGEANAVELIAAAVVLEREARPVQRSRRVSPRVAALAAAAAAVCALPLTGAMAAAAALPKPAQDVASAVLDKVGISVPSSGEDPADGGPTPTTGVPAPPATDGSTPGAGAPSPNVQTSPPALSTPPTPGNDQGDPDGKPGKSQGDRDGKPGKGAHSNNADQGPHGPKNPSGGGNGNGHDQ